ncbi:MAG: RidA family protein [Acidobacteriota bacterium]
MRTVSTSEAPQPRGHYSQAIIHGGLVYVSGQLPIDAKTGKRHIGPIEEQTEQVLDNVRAVLEAAGTDLQRVIKTTIYISDLALWEQANHVYARFFGEHRPAQAIVPTKTLHLGFQIEVEAIASIEGSAA